MASVQFIMECAVHDAIKRVKKLILAFIELHDGNEAKTCNWTASPERLIANRRQESDLINSYR